MPFQQHEQTGLVWFTADVLNDVPHGFSTRKGGVSQGIFASVPLRLAPCGGSLRRNPGGTRPDLRQNDSIPALSYHVFAVCQPKSREKFPRNQLP